MITDVPTDSMLGGVFIWPKRIHPSHADTLDGGTCKDIDNIQIY